MIPTKLTTLAVAFVIVSRASVLADLHTTGVPVLSSRPGATYTHYLDPAGFNWTGPWASFTPGNAPAFNNVANNGVFNAAEVASINAMWAAQANKFRSFNVNVTTVDPYDAVGDPTPTDVERRDYYDTQPHMMHTVIGEGNGWQGGNDGLAFGSGIDTVRPLDGGHTNWMFTNAQTGSLTLANANYIGTIAAHETGHTYGLHHQGDWTGGIVVNENGQGDNFIGPGSYVPLMGNADARQRITWRVGSSVDAPNNFQNDVGVMMANDGMEYADSGIGHTFATATPLPLLGSIVDVTQADGVISPASAAIPDPIGVNNYTKDVFSFISDGVNPIALTCHNGTDFLTPGVADPGVTLRSTFSIYDSLGVQVGSSTEDATTLFSTYSALLAAGSYFVEIASFGGHAEINPSFNSASYYDMGGYFLTGSGFVAIPEPGAFLLVALALSFTQVRRFVCWMNFLKVVTLRRGT